MNINYKCIKPVVYDLKLRKQLTFTDKNRKKELYKDVKKYVNTLNSSEKVEIYSIISYNIRKILGKYKTYKNETGKILTNVNIPKGLSVIRPLNVNKTLFDKAYDDIKKMFQNYKKTNLQVRNHNAITGIIFFRYICKRSKCKNEYSK
jgi:hypothetical protein